MSNLWLAVLSTVLTLAILTALWFLRRHVTKSLGQAMATVHYIVEGSERSLRSHIVDEMDQIQIHTTELAANTLGQLDRTESVIVNFVKTHADSLHKHAEDLRNHAKELTDRAEVQASAPRQAVTRT